MNISLRKAIKNDIDMIFRWRNDPWIVSLGTSRKTVTWEEHEQWFNKILVDDSHLLYIIESQENELIGVVRLDKDDEQYAVISIYLMREFTGRGLGVQAIVKTCMKGFAQWPIDSIHAYIRNENAASVSAFTKAGFELIEPEINCPPDHKEMIFKREACI